MNSVPDGLKQISSNIWTTGRLRGVIDEQSLVLDGTKGLYVVTGCSHPGVDSILTSASQLGKIRGIIGGFHGFKDFNVLNNLDFICPCHCTEYKKELRYMFPSKISGCGVGKIIDID